MTTQVGPQAPGHSLWVAFITGAREVGVTLQDAAGHADPRTTRCDAERGEAWR